MTMKHNEIRNALYPDCPVRNVLSRVGDKWSMLVLFTLEGQPSIRFKELQRSIPDISQKILTATLKMLEADGLINREAFPEVPARGVFFDRERQESSATYRRTSLVGNRQYGGYHRLEDTILS